MKNYANFDEITVYYASAPMVIGQKVKGQLVADVLNSQHAGTGATWRINTKILSTCRPGRGHRPIVPASIRTACFGSGER